MCGSRREFTLLFVTREGAPRNAENSVGLRSLTQSVRQAIDRDRHIWCRYAHEAPSATGGDCACLCLSRIGSVRRLDEGRFYDGGLFSVMTGFSGTNGPPAGESLKSLWIVSTSLHAHAPDSPSRVSPSRVA